MFLVRQLTLLLCLMKNARFATLHDQYFAD